MLKQTFSNFLLALVAGSLWAGPVIAKPAAECVAIHEFASDDYTKIFESLPQKIKLPKDNADIQNLFQEATSGYAQSFRVEQVTNFVKQILDTGVANLSKKDFKNLKEFRKQAQVIRSSFILFSSDHVCPDKFDDFVRYFGKMNERGKESLGNEENGAKKEKKAKKYATVVMNHLEAHDQDLSTYNVQPTSIGNFNNYLAEMKQKILASVDTVDMTVVEYHDLRKWVRDFKTLIDLQLQRDKTSKLKLTAIYLEFLNKALGDSKDDYKDEEKAREDEVRATLTPDLRVLIRELFSKI